MSRGRTAARKEANGRRTVFGTRVRGAVANPVVSENGACSAEMDSQKGARRHSGYRHSAARSVLIFSMIFTTAPITFSGRGGHPAT